MADFVVHKSFPAESLVPKHETGVTQFLKKYPTYDGQGVTVAIFDSGVDPKACGLETNPNGSVKVIERFDCSGCGDVDTSKKVALSPEGTIVGLSGRTFKITDSILQDAIGTEFHVGLKSLHDLYPPKVHEKLIADSKLKTWDETHKQAVADQTRRIAQFDVSNSSSLNMTVADKLHKEDLDNGLECLQYFDKLYPELKTFYDCIVYETTDGWRCAIDIANGDLDKAVNIGEYSKTHEIKTIDELLSVSINVHDGGNTLEIVGMCSSHGTHVSSIVAANHGPYNREELNGVAPGAKIVSLTIGDGRLGSMETGTAIIRALMKVMELCNTGRRVHLINMSYGEFAHWTNSGRIGEIINEVVNDYGVVMVCSAGNHGPALCTVGTPPDVADSPCIGVGAYVSSEMMESEYALREKLPSNVYTWTSRDPCIDGGQGVTVIAPGASIASVPQYTLNRQQLMNGTSMSAPHVCGAIALMISGLLQKNIEYSPYSIRRAITNTARKVAYIDEFAQGSGLLNVEEAYEHLVKYNGRAERDIRFSITVGTYDAKGIHLRRGFLDKPEEFNVAILPQFMTEKYHAAKPKIAFNMRLTLVPTQPWIQCGKFLDICYSQRSICVKVDPTGLPPGVHTGKVLAYEAGDIEKGTVFEVPVTVVQPIVLEPRSNWHLQFDTTVCKPNTILRHFVLVPNNATWAVVKLRSLDTVKSTQAKFLIHTMQILPHKYCKTFDVQKILPVSSECETVHYFRVEPNNILEVCIAKYWSNFGTATLSSSIEFHGVETKTPCNMIHGAAGVSRLDLISLQREELAPAVQLKAAMMVLKPTETKISPLTSRDVLPHGRQIYQNLLTFALNLNKQQEVAFSLPLLNYVLYESEFDSQFWMCFDSNKRLVASGDAYSGNTFTKLTKGEYTIRVQVRHEKKEPLEKLNEATLTAAIKLSNPLSLEVFGTYRSALLTDKKINSCTVPALRHIPFYVSPLSNEKLSKAGIPAGSTWLQGTLMLPKDDLARKIDTTNFEYILPEGSYALKKSNGAAKAANGNKDSKTKLDEYREGLRDYQNAQLSKLDLADAEEVYAKLIKEFPTFMPAHIAFIQKLDVVETKNSLPFTFKSSLDKMTSADIKALETTLKRVVNLTTTVINGTNADLLLVYYGMKSDSRPDAAKIKIEMDKQKNTLLDAYVRKFIALGKLHVIAAKQTESETPRSEGADLSLELRCVGAPPSHGLGPEFDSIYTEVGKFVEYNDQKVIALSLWHAHLKQHNGRMAKIVQKMYEEKNQKEIMEEMQYVVRANKWNHIGDILQKVITAFPASYRLF